MHPPMMIILAEQTDSPERWSVGNIDVYAEPPTWFLFVGAVVIVIFVSLIIRALRG